MSYHVAQLSQTGIIDTLWRGEKKLRGKAYELMRELMWLDKEHAHIGMLDVEQCKQLIEKLKEHLKC